MKVLVIGNIIVLLCCITFLAMTLKMPPVIPFHDIVLEGSANE